MTKRRQGKRRKAESASFNLWESLNSTLADLRRIDSLIPCEASRYWSKLDEEAQAIVISRKDDLLKYIQTVCRDSIHFGQAALDTWMETRR